MVGPEWGDGQIDATRRRDAEPECRQLEVNVAEVDRRTFQEDEAVIRHFGEGSGQLACAVEDAALEPGAEPRPVAQRRMAKRRVQEVVEVFESLRHGQLRALVDQLLEQLLLRVGVDELARRVPELRLDHAAEAAAERTGLRGSRASRPDIRRHGPTRAWR